MSAVCPSCGVAIVPGYVRCPKCHAGLPQGRGWRTGDPGGTSLENERGFPIAAVVVAVAVTGAIIAFFASRGDDPVSPKAPRPTRMSGMQTPAPPLVTNDTPPTTRPQPALIAPTVPDPLAAAEELERLLRRQRLWASVDVSGSNVEVRSSACSDPGMAPVVDAARGTLRSAGLTRLRCVAQSGRVVFERDL